MANNNFYLPGDAFFPTLLDDAIVERVTADESDPTTFAYSAYGGYSEAFCGYAGYKKAKVSMDRSFVDDLKRAYRLTIKLDPSLGKEPARKDIDFGAGKRHGVKVLFYNASFSFPKKHRLGLRYNENWVAEVAKFGHREDHIRLCCLVKDMNAVMESWRDAARVKPLNVSVPKEEATPDGKAVLAIKGPVKAYVLDSRPLAEYFRKNSRVVRTLYEVDSKGVTEHSRTKGKWTSTKHNY